MIINVIFYYFLASFVLLFSKSNGAEIDKFLLVLNAGDVSTAKKYEKFGNIGLHLVQIKIIIL